jgi:uncharacterized protein
MAHTLFSMHAQPLRLFPGDDLKLALDRLIYEKGWRAATILSGIGSLSCASVRFAGRKEPTKVAGPLEIISLSGTLASFGGSHLHICLSDSQGNVIGGHLKEGSIIRTTGEIVIGVLDGYAFHREHDPETDSAELVISLA